MSQFVPIKTDPAAWWYGESDHDIEYREHDHAEVESLLLGHKVTKAADDHLVLDDGTVLKFVGHEGGCACSAGCYDLTELNGTDNIITAVEFVDDPDGDGWSCPAPDCKSWYCTDDTHPKAEGYRIFVLAGDKRINLATFEGSDGNGYYGTGYHILVRRPKQEDPR